MALKRYLVNQIKQDLIEKMVFVGGPRQVGKTTLSKSLMSSKDLYLNWDLTADRLSISKEAINLSPKLIIFDEIHKFKNWRALVKGYFDKYSPDLKILVTGSARLDHFR